MNGENKDYSKIISKALFVLICIFGLVTIYTFLWGKAGVLPGLPNMDEDAQWIYYAIFSFAVVIALAAFHLYVSLFLNKKRR